MIDHLKNTDAPQCFTVNYLPKTDEYEMRIGNQPYYHYEKLIELEVKEKGELRDRIKQLEGVLDRMKEKEGAVMEDPSSNWTAGYKEVKNFIHNELGITKEQMDKIIEQGIRNETDKVVGANHDFIRLAIKEILRDELLFAIHGEEYPRVRRNIWDYTKESKSPFSKFISDILKEEILEMFRHQFDVGIDIKQKESSEE